MHLLMYFKIKISLTFCKKSSSDHPLEGWPADKQTMLDTSFTVMTGISALSAWVIIRTILSFFGMGVIG